MDIKQLRFQDSLEFLLFHNPLPCRVINRKINVYKHRYEDDRWLSGYRNRYEHYINLERNEPHF